MFRPKILALAVAVALAGCGDADGAGDRAARDDAEMPSVAGDGDGASPPGTREEARGRATALASNDAPAPDRAVDEAALVAEVARELQACSYDGSPVSLDARAMSDGAVGAGARVVAEIMKFTGLPQNFDVVEAPVPNAAAAIVLGPDRVPRRVIAYSRTFMEDVRRATGDDAWAPISIMAHEVGHHLSGHTITPGGSQPPTELEADKFSGFVLYKMGAALADAQRAMESLVPESDGRTHPGRAKRVAAIRDGWQQACTQAGGTCDVATVARSDGPRSEAPRIAAPASAPTTAPGEAAPTTTTDATSTVASLPAADAKPTLPAPSADAIASKFDRFVIDELGLLHAPVREKLAKDMYDYAQRSNVEIVTIVAKDLHGMSGDDYAYAMMRQLRVGKLDVGNGAVLVIAPGEKQVGVALGSGLRLEIDDKRVDLLVKAPLRSFLDNYDKSRSGIAGWSPRIADAADYVMRDTKNWDWVVRYQSLAELVDTDAAEAAERRETGAKYEPMKSKTWRKLARIEGKLTSLSGSADPKRQRVAQFQLDRGRQVVELTTDDGRSVLLVVAPRLEDVMPTRLEVGKRYAMVVRADSVDMLRFGLLSYDVLD